MSPRLPIDSIKSVLLEKFKKNVDGLKRKQSKFVYEIMISLFQPFKPERFLAGRVTFHPVGKENSDVPLLTSKSLEILRETTEYLFDVSIQGAVALFNGDFYGFSYFKDETSTKKEGKVSFELKALIEDSYQDCFVIGLPESDFNFNDTRPLHVQLLTASLTKREWDSSAWVHNANISETYDFEEEFSLMIPRHRKPPIALGVDLNVSEISRSNLPDLQVKVLQEFKINKHLTLKLLDNATLGKKSTRIFIDNSPFLQCMYIILNDPQENPLQLEIDSIDEATEKLDSRLEFFFSPTTPISPESIFWAHCSNLQVWYELGYDSRILHSNLSFPLLKKLVDVEDPKAKKVFREEIAKRILGKYLPVTIYLLKERYLDYLNDSEIEYIFHTLSKQIMIPNSELKNEKFANVLLKIGSSYLEKGVYAGHLAIDLCIRLRNLLNSHPSREK